MVILTVFGRNLLGLLLFLSGQEERILWDCFSESQRKLQQGKVSLLRAEFSTEARRPQKNFMQPNDHSEYRGHPDCLGPPSSVSTWEISTSLTVLSEQTHPWERAWDELVSSNQSYTKSKGKATPASKGQSLLSNHFVFSFKGTNCVASDFSSWIY